MLRHRSELYTSRHEIHAACTENGTVSTGLTPSLGRKRGWLVAIVATSAMSVSYIDRQTLAALAPTVRTALSIDHTHYGWLAAAFAMAYLVAAPLAGLLVDRVGARVGLASAVLVWSFVSVAHAAVPTFLALFILRIALGVAEAPSFPAAAQAVKRGLPVRDRAMGFGVLFIKFANCNNLKRYSRGSLSSTILSRPCGKWRCHWIFLLRMRENCKNCDANMMPC